MGGTNGNQKAGTQIQVFLLITAAGFGRSATKTMPQSPLLSCWLLLAALFCGCATTSTQLQPQIAALVAAQRLPLAAQTIQNAPAASYGKKNELLYLMDKALVLHLAGQYQESIPVFEAAKTKINRLYTQSLTNLASTWLINDTSGFYRGENFEHIFLNIFAALNYAALGNFSEALVEMRDVDIKLSLLTQALQGTNRKYQDDPLARLLSGLLFEIEAPNDFQNLNDALVAYKKALRLYSQESFGGHPPRILLENLLSVSEALGDDELNDFKKKHPDIAVINFDDRRQNAEIYIVEYIGLSPLKHPATIPIPLPGGLTQISFPHYDPRPYEIAYTVFKLTDAAGKNYEISGEVVADLERVAEQNLEDRKTQIYSKALLRPAAKYIAQQTAVAQARQKEAAPAAYALAGAGSLYTLFSEQADVRCWMTLPAQIHLSRFILPPGEYAAQALDFDAEKKSLGQTSLKNLSLNSGDKKILIRPALN